jgi:hypothetical protein
MTATSTATISAAAAERARLPVDIDHLHVGSHGTSKLWVSESDPDVFVTVSFTWYVPA